MIELARHIEILLLENDCVIIPDFGGFIAHYQPARNNTLLQISNLIRIYIYTSYVYASFGKTCSGNKSYIPGPYNRYIHFI